MIPAHFFSWIADLICLRVFDIVWLSYWEPRGVSWVVKEKCIQQRAPGFKLRLHAYAGRILQVSWLPTIKVVWASSGPQLTLWTIKGWGVSGHQEKKIKVTVGCSHSNGHPKRFCWLPHLYNGILEKPCACQILWLLWER